GWGGGAVRSWQRGADTAVALHLVFDSPRDAAEACAGVPRWYSAVADASQQPPGSTAQGDRDALVYHCPGTQVRLGLAPDPDSARAAAGL
ncbi:MAG: hypothetical protein M3276_01565, partial [Actinomycetota bacterium]|nr:hypothetical protein [Actinomycetota bacterium]